MWGARNYVTNEAGEDVVQPEEDMGGTMILLIPFVSAIGSLAIPDWLSQGHGQ